MNGGIAACTLLLLGAACTPTAGGRSEDAGSPNEPDCTPRWQVMKEAFAPFPNLVSVAEGSLHIQMPPAGGDVWLENVGAITGDFRVTVEGSVLDQRPGNGGTVSVGVVDVHWGEFLNYSLWATYGHRDNTSDPLLVAATRVPSCEGAVCSEDYLDEEDPDGAVAVTMSIMRQGDEATVTVETAQHAVSVSASHPDLGATPLIVSLIADASFAARPGEGTPADVFVHDFSFEGAGVASDGFDCDTIQPFSSD